MNGIRVSRFLFVPLLVSAGFVAAAAVHAQSDSDSGKVLVIQREFTKPGKDGAVHEATEAGFIRAVQANKGNIHYIALTSLSGTNRAHLHQRVSFAGSGGRGAQGYACRGGSSNGQGDGCRRRCADRDRVQHLAASR